MIRDLELCECLSECDMCQRVLNMVLLNEGSAFQPLLHAPLNHAPIRLDALSSPVQWITGYEQEA